MLLGVTLERLNTKKMISTSEWCVEHLLAGQNTQQQSLCKAFQSRLVGESYLGTDSHLKLTNNQNNPKTR